MPGEHRRHEFLEKDGDTSFVTTHMVDNSHDGWRVDLFLKEKLKRKSRAFIQKSIESGQVQLTPRDLGETPRLKPSTLLRMGDEVQITTNRTHPEPEVDFNYKTLLEDEHIFVIDKPGNLPVHPAGRFFFNTLLTRLRTEHFEEFKDGQDFYMVHRIDRETSGVLLMAKTSPMAAHLVAQFREHKIKKRYLAIAQGCVKEDNFTVDAPLDKDPHANIRLKMAVVPGGMESQTDFKVLERTKRFTLLEVSPRTGRQHQIRVHAAHVGHPLVGDKIYGFDERIFFSYLNHGIIDDEMKEALILPRQALHAHSLEFTHPHTGEYTCVKSPLPLELKLLLAKDRL